MISFLNIRKKFYADVNRKFKNNRLGKNYSKFKVYICLEIGILLTYLFLKLRIKPNTVTIVFVLILFLATVLIATGNKELTLLGMIIYFFKNSLDLSDGFIARLTKQTSSLGSILDIWAGSVSITFFQISVGFYVFVKSNDPIFLILTLVIIVLNSIDFKKVYLIEKANFKKNISFNFKDNLNSKKKNIIIKFLGSLDYDGRSRYTDLVLLIFLLEIYNTDIFVSQYIIILWLMTNTGKFFYKFYKTISINKKL